MADSSEPLLRIDQSHPEGKSDSLPHFVLLFNSPFDPKNQEELDKMQDLKESREALLSIFKTTVSDLGSDEALSRVLHKVDWFTEEYIAKHTEITKRDFLVGTISAIVNLLENNLNLETSLFQSRDRDEIFCRIWAKEDWLIQQAEEMGYKLQFKCAESKKELEESEFKTVSPYAPFETEKRGAVPGSKKLYKRYNFRDKEKEEGSLFTYNDKVRIIMEATSQKFDSNLLKDHEVLIEDFCVHHKKNLDKLKREWATLKALFKPQPLDLIRTYFGEKVSMYFGWMNTYMKFMIVAAVVGAAIFITEIVYTRMHDAESSGTVPVNPEKPENPQDSAQPTTLLESFAPEVNLIQILTVFFAFFMAIWGSSFDQAWVRQEKTYAWKWGTVNFEEEEGQRGDFKGEFKYDEVSGKYKKIRDSSLWYKLKMTTSYSIAGIFVVIVIVSVGGIFLYRGILKHQGVASGVYLCAALNAIQIRVMNIVYGKIAVWMTDWENHETETQYLDNLALKLFLFKFINSYISLFYIAFIKSMNEGCDGGDCMRELSVQLSIIFGVNLFLNCVELGMPFLKHYRKVRAEDKKIELMRQDDPTIRLKMGHVESQAKLEEYESPMDDYMEMGIQYGYVALFCVAFPLLPVLALIELVLEIRVDALKLCLLTKRPNPSRAEDIGVWRSILLTVSFFAAITNPAMIVFSSNIFSELSLTYKFALFLIMEHLLFFFKFMIDVVVPDQPSVVRRGLTWSDRKVQERLYGLDQDKTKEERQEEKSKKTKLDKGKLLDGFHLRPEHIAFEE